MIPLALCVLSRNCDVFKLFTGHFPVEATKTPGGRYLYQCLGCRSQKKNMCYPCFTPFFVWMPSWLNESRCYPCFTPQLPLVGRFTQVFWGKTHPRYPSKNRLKPSTSSVRSKLTSFACPSWDQASGHPFAGEASERPKKTLLTKRQPNLVGAS